MQGCLRDFLLQLFVTGNNDAKRSLRNASESEFSGVGIFVVVVVFERRKKRSRLDFKIHAETCR